MRINKIILVSLLALTASCTDWLDVTPKNEVVEKDLYSEATGARNVLNGLYKNMASTSLYGRELSFGLVEAVAQTYNLYGKNGFYGVGIKSYSPYYRAANYEYTYNKGIVSIIDGIWESAYKIIANANNLIINIDDMPDSKFRYGKVEKDMIKGEALAIRALCHFDLLRVYAPAPATGSSAKIVHYATQYDVNGDNFHTVPLTNDEILKKVADDLKQAATLIEPFELHDNVTQDNLANSFRFESNMSSPDIFYQFRGYRFNIMAVNAVLARVYNYWGKHTEALATADKVINYQINEETVLDFISRWDVSKNRKFTTDLIFGVSYATLETDYATYRNANSNDGMTLAIYNSHFVNYAYTDKADYRLKNLISVSEDGKNVFPLKHVPHAAGANYADIIPMIRLSEMYFIKADAYAAAQDYTKASEMLNVVRAARNCSRVEFGFNDADSYHKVKVIEFARDLFQEGQTFFEYKKFNLPVNSKMTLDKFVFPTPDSQEI